MEECVSRRMENEFVFPDGSTAWFDLSIQPVSKGISILSDDITARKQGEEVLKEHSEQLERMVVERTRELEEAQERMVRQERLAVLGQLAGEVGHELRNPLWVISHAVYYLETVLSDADEKTRRYLGMIAAEVRSADGIISGLLDFTRVKPVSRERVEVPELLARALEEQPPPEETEVVTETSPELPAARVDPGQLEQVFANLVTNACQAMPGGGRLTIRTHRAQDRVAVSVEELTVLLTLAEGVQIRLDQQIEMTTERLREWSAKMVEGVERMSSVSRTCRPSRGMARRSRVRGSPSAMWYGGRSP